MGEVAAQIVAEIESSFRKVGVGVSVVRPAPDIFRRSNSHAGGVKHDEAVGVLKNSGRVDRYEIGDGLYVTLAVGPADDDLAHSLLVFATEDPKGVGYGRMISSAWRLANVPNDASATEAFALLIEEFGLPVEVGTVTGRFVASLVVEGLGDQNLVGVLGDADGSWTVSALVRTLDAAHSGVRWAYAIDDVRYKEHAATLVGQP